MRTKNLSIEQFANELVADWAESGKLTLRPSEKALLKKLVASAVPQLLSHSTSEALDIHTRTVKQQQKKLCMEAVSALRNPSLALSANNAL